jgi:uncharacterized membrane protein (UPF0127 family)
MLQKVLFFIAIVLVFLVVFDAFFHNKPTKMDVVLGGKTFIMDIADTPVLQTQGLSGRTALSNDAGMIFVFSTPGEYGFWMKDMNFPLDIVWISPDSHIIFMEKSLATSTYPQVYYPTSPAQYVLEISAGQADALNLKIGDAVNFIKK